MSNPDLVLEEYCFILDKIYQENDELKSIIENNYIKKGE